MLFKKRKNILTHNTHSLIMEKNKKQEGSYSLKNEQVGIKIKTDFYDAIKIINNYIKNKNWKGAKNALNEIKKKEQISHDIFINKITNEKEKILKKKEFDKNILLMNKLEKVIKEREKFESTNKVNIKIKMEKAPIINENIQNNNIEKNVEKDIDNFLKRESKHSLKNFLDFLFKKNTQGNNQKNIKNKKIEGNVNNEEKIVEVLENIEERTEITEEKKETIIQNDSLLQTPQKNENNIGISKKQINDFENNNGGVFHKEKKFDMSKIKDFNDAIHIIKVFIFTEEWENAHKAIEEIRKKEEEALNIFINSIEDVQKQEEEQKKFKKNSFYISKIEVKLKQKEQKYNDRISAEKFKIKFKKIKEEITLLSKTNKTHEALRLLSNFMEDNKDKYVVIKFYNTQKKIIQKAIEKERIKEEISIKKNTKKEALQLIGEIKGEEEIQSTINKASAPENKKAELKKKKNLIDLFNFYKVILEKRRKRKLIDEVTSLIDSQNQAEIDIAQSKLEKVHQGLIKELSVTNIKGYEFYGKILGATKISGDTFGFVEDKNKYSFFLGDATGHGVRAGLIVSLLSRLFNRYSLGYEFKKMIYEINNGLKQDLQSRNFITGIFFEIEKENHKIINYIGMGHEPMFIHRVIEQKTEKIIVGGLAAGIRKIMNEENIKIKNIKLENNDILVCFSDGIVESRNVEGEMYGISRLEECINKNSNEGNITKIYNAIIDDVKIFKGGAKFEDDATIIILKRNEQKDIVKQRDTYLQNIALREGLSKNSIKKMIGKTKEEVEEELEKIRQEKKTKNIIKILEGYYYTGEILVLKQEAIRFIKEGFIHPKINKYLRLAIENEGKYKIEQKNKKMESKYNVLKTLMKKGDYITVIKECNEIIAKDGNI